MKTLIVASLLALTAVSGVVVTSQSAAALSLSTPYGSRNFIPGTCGGPTVLCSAPRPVYQPTCGYVYYYGRYVYVCR